MRSTGKKIVAVKMAARRNRPVDVHARPKGFGESVKIEKVVLLGKIKERDVSLLLSCIYGKGVFRSLATVFYYYFCQFFWLTLKVLFTKSLKDYEANR